MKLIHSTHELRDVKKILEQGLKSPKETKNSEYCHTSNSSVICFAALEKKRIEYDIYGCWGDYHFILNDEWLKQNIGQFREHGEKDSEKRFFEFARRIGLQSYKEKEYVDTAWNQVLSLKPVPIEGIETLVVPKSDLEFIDFYIPEHIKLSVSNKITVPE